MQTDTTPKVKKKTLLVALNHIDAQDFMNRYPRYHFDDLTIVNVDNPHAARGKTVDRVVFTPAVQERVPTFKEAFAAHLPSVQ